MESTLQLEIVTPDKVVVSQTVDYVGVPGIEGEFGVLPHHVPLLSALVRYRDGKYLPYFLILFFIFGACLRFRLFRGSIRQQTHRAGGIRRARGKH